MLCGALAIVREHQTAECERKRPPPGPRPFCTGATARRRREACCSLLDLVGPSERARTCVDTQTWSSSNHCYNSHPPPHEPAIAGVRSYNVSDPPTSMTRHHAGGPSHGYHTSQATPHPPPQKANAAQPSAGPLPRPRGSSPPSLRNWPSPPEQRTAPQTDRSARPPP